MTGGKNGSTPFENLAQMRQKRVFETNAEPEHSKCVAHPTKRAWKDAMEAIREAEARSEAARMPIVAYRCESCSDVHLCKRQNARVGSILERPVLPDPDPPLVLGNADAKRKVLRDFLAERDETTTDELCELLDVGRKSLTSYMADLPWHNTRGRHARWVPDATTEPVDEVALPAPANFEVFRGKGQSARNLKALDASQSRHPAAQQVGWETMPKLDTIRHIPVGDLLDMLTAMGRELRIQTRDTP